LLSDHLPYLLILGGLVACSAFFSGSEVALFSLRRSDREQLARSSDVTDRRILRLVTRPRRLLATLLIGNESVNIAMSAVMAALVDKLYAGASEMDLALMATFFALPLLLFFGEITPKTIAMGSSRGWSRRAARPLAFFAMLVTPVRLVVRFVAELILRPISGAEPWEGTKDISEDEFKALVDAGSAEGEVDAHERRLIHRVFEFGDKTVADAMQPREKVFSLSYGLPVARLIKEVAARGFSRVPIYQRSLDNICGVLYAKDLVLLSAGHSGKTKLSELLHTPYFVPQTSSLEQLFALFKKGKTHMAFVVNEYGRLVGIVTMEDVLEELFGEILDERELQKSLSSKLREPTEPEIPAQERA
jgi:CBS domain containing-hemolysin-like protein